MSRKWAVALLVLIVGAAFASGQRRVTPVRAPKAVDVRDSVTIEADSMTISPAPPHVHDEEGNFIFIDTVGGSLDTLSVVPAKPSKMIYPLIHSVAVGIDIWDPVMRIIGQHYGIGSAWAELSMHNRYFPYIEAGLSSANDTPSDRNFTFKSPVAPFFKIGASYNIFYNSNPAYQLKFGLRYGFTSFKYEIADVAVDETYWGGQAHFSIPSQTVTAGYLEIVAAIKVTLWRNLALGWALKYHSILHESSAEYGEPMIIPGFGKRNNAFTGAFSVIYTLPLNNSKSSVVSNNEPQK